RAGDYPTMIEPLLREREAAGMPPFGFLALVRVDAATPEASLHHAEKLAVELRRHARDVRVLGPAPAPRHRVNRRYREQILLLNPSRAKLHQVLADARRHWETHPLPRNVRVAIDVDPITLS
ncbi:MAG TPA: primosomal protein N', partial [Thioalkalivibrio sp.]|nr:primosomal protein N' [Thioalkalivibrio sp.]